MDRGFAIDRFCLAGVHSSDRVSSLRLAGGGACRRNSESFKTVGGGDLVYPGTLFLRAMGSVHIPVLSADLGIEIDRRDRQTVDSECASTLLGVVQRLEYSFNIEVL